MDNNKWFVILSAPNDVPSLLLSFVADAGPAGLLVSKQILGAFQVGDDVGSTTLESSSAGNNGFLNIESTFDG